MDENRRLAQRKNAFRFGSIRIDGQPEPIDCLIWDESESGAMIEIEAAESVPDRFELSRGGDKPERTCLVVRRSGRRVGVKFE